MTLPHRLTDLAGLPAAAFIRESTEGQFDNFGPARQRRTIQQFADTYGLRIVMTREIPESGRTVWQHPGANEILAGAAAGTIRAVIVAMIDRAGRNLARTALYAEDLHDAGAVLIAADSEQISGNPAHLRAMQTGMLQAAHQSAIIGENVTEGIFDRWQKHGDPWGFAPLGFRRLRAEPTEDEPAPKALLAIDPETMPQAVALFERYVTGTISFDQLAEDAPILTTGRYKGQPMTREGIADLLANPLFNGWASFKGETRPAQWRDNPPVSDELWERVQEVRAGRVRAGGSRPTNRVNLFEGLYYCAGCDQRLRFDGMAGNTNSTRRHRLRHANPCPTWGTVERKQTSRWEDALVEQVANVEISSEVTGDIMAHLTEGTTPPPASASRMRRELNEVAQQLMAGTITGQQAEERLQAIRAEQAAAVATAPRPTITRAQVQGALENLRETWKLAEPATRAQLVRAIYRKVPIYSDGTFGGVQLTPSAIAKGLPRALPEEVTLPTSGNACPRGLEPPTFRSAT